MYPGEIAQGALALCIRGCKSQVPLVLSQRFMIATGLKIEIAQMGERHIKLRVAHQGLVVLFQSFVVESRPLVAQSQTVVSIWFCRRQRHIALERLDSFVMPA